MREPLGDDRRMARGVLAEPAQRECRADEPLRVPVILEAAEREARELAGRLAGELQHALNDLRLERRFAELVVAPLTADAGFVEKRVERMPADHDVGPRRGVRLEERGVHRREPVEECRIFDRRLPEEPPAEIEGLRTDIADLHPDVVGAPSPDAGDLGQDVALSRLQEFHDPRRRNVGQVREVAAEQRELVFRVGHSSGDELPMIDDELERGVGIHSTFRSKV